METRSLEELKLWSRARGGEPETFGLIYDQHRDRVLRHCVRLVRSIPDAEDLTALVFLEAWRRRVDVRVVDGSIIGWLLVTANNVIRNFDRTLRRHQSAMAKLPLPTHQPDHGELVLASMESLGTHRGLRAAFAQLSQRDQDVLTLCVLEDLSTAQTGKALGVPTGTVKSRLSRAKRHLADALRLEIDRPTTEWNRP
jgi:RNA polymerase sigma-70 factor (ECF subfamily)